MAVLTQKAIKVLEVLDRNPAIIAQWCQQELCDLQRVGFAISSAAVIPTGKLSSNKIWVITEDGKVFLRDERGGQ